MNNNFEENFLETKDKLIFEYTFLDFDPQKKYAEEIIEKNKELLKEIIVEKSEIFWLKALGHEFNASFSFPFENVDIGISYQKNMPGKVICYCRSLELIEKQKNINEQYFIWDWDLESYRSFPINLGNVVKRAEQKGEIFQSDFKTILPSFSPDEIPKKLGFTADPIIADLVIILNRLGIYTVSSCEGHPERGKFQPSIMFPNIVLFKLLSCLKDWEEINNPALKIKAFDFGAESFNKQSFNLLFDAGELEKSRLLVDSLSKYLNGKSKE